MMTPLEKLTNALEAAIGRARAAGLANTEILEAVDDARWALVGDEFLIQHYGGVDQVPPRLTQPRGNDHG